MCHVGICQWWKSTVTSGTCKEFCVYKISVQLHSLTLHESKIYSTMSNILVSKKNYGQLPFAKKMMFEKLGRSLTKFPTELNMLKRDTFSAISEIGLVHLFEGNGLFGGNNLTWHFVQKKPQNYVAQSWSRKGDSLFSTVCIYDICAFHFQLKPSVDVYGLEKIDQWEKTQR